MQMVIRDLNRYLSFYPALSDMQDLNLMPNYDLAVHFLLIWEPEAAGNCYNCSK